MTVSILRRQPITFVVSDESIQITKTLDGQRKTLVYGDPSCSDAIQNELEWLAQEHPGTFRLLWMTLLPWSEATELFVQYAETYGITL